VISVLHPIRQKVRFSKLRLQPMNSICQIRSVAAPVVAELVPVAKLLREHGGVAAGRCHFCCRGSCEKCFFFILRISKFSLKFGA